MLIRRTPSESVQKDRAVDCVVPQRLCLSRKRSTTVCAANGSGGGSLWQLGPAWAVVLPHVQLLFRRSVPSMPRLHVVVGQ